MVGVLFLQIEVRVPAGYLKDNHRLQAKKTTWDPKTFFTNFSIAGGIYICMRLVVCFYGSSFSCSGARGRRRGRG